MTVLLEMARRDGATARLTATPEGERTVRLRFTASARGRTEERDFGVESTVNRTEILDLIEAMREDFAAKGFRDCAADAVQ